MLPANLKKVSGVSWEQIVLEAITALTDGAPSVAVSTEEMYRWIEETEYLTDYGRSPDPAWQADVPSYRASLQLRWQRMVASGDLARDQSGVYRLTRLAIVPAQMKWQELIQADQQVSEPTVQRVLVRRIQRSQRLRDLLVNYYGARCQVCDAQSPYLIPTGPTGRCYVEVHHVLGLAEAVALRQDGALVGLRVNGLQNLTVLCPHHHALMHHHWPPYQFDRTALVWHHSAGGILPLKHITQEHAGLLKSASAGN